MLNVEKVHASLPAMALFMNAIVIKVGNRLVFLMMTL